MNTVANPFFKNAAIVEHERLERQVMRCLADSCHLGQGHIARKDYPRNAQLAEERRAFGIATGGHGTQVNRQRRQLGGDQAEQHWIGNDYRMPTHSGETSS
ncbi:hypothetical protein D3C85_1137280 [compost metagenome]